MVEEIAGSRPVIPIDVPLMRHALQLKSRYGIAYWDAAVIAGAHRLGASPFVLTMLLMIAALWYWPALALWIPGLASG